MLLQPTRFTGPSRSQQCDAQNGPWRPGPAPGRLCRRCIPSQRSLAVQVGAGRRYLFWGLVQTSRCAPSHSNSLLVTMLPPASSRHPRRTRSQQSASQQHQQPAAAPRPAPVGLVSSRTLAAVQLGCCSRTPACSAGSSAAALQQMPTSFSYSSPSGCRRQTLSC